MEPDLEQALRWKYARKAVLVMPLTSGKFAIYDGAFQLEAILDAAPSGQELNELSQKFAFSPAQARQGAAERWSPDSKDLLKSYADDESEALLRRWGEGALLVLPLKSGRLAVFDRNAELICFSSEAPSLGELRGWSEEMLSRAQERQKRSSLLRPSFEGGGKKLVQKVDVIPEGL